MKQCTRCSRDRPPSMFSKRKRAKDGLTAWCKECVAEYHKEHYRVHRLKYLGYQKEHRGTHRIETVGYQKQYRQTINGCLRKRYQLIDYRCSNPKAVDYGRYGGRGIKNLFRSFDEFFYHITVVLGFDTRKKIGDLQIDRIDNDGHYEEGNIRFSTRSENMLNTRRKKCLL